MVNRKIIISLISKCKDKLLNDEIAYFLEEDREYEYDAADALDDALSFAEENNEKSLIKKIRAILINAGYFIKAPEKTDVGRDTRFTFNKEKYACVKYWSGWIEE